MRKLLASGLVLLCFFITFLLFSFKSVTAKPAPKNGGTDFETCKGCHEEVANRFERTPKGVLFTKNPRNTVEALICESCHGPAADHADSEGQEFGNMIRFKKTSPGTVSRRNQACLQCHEKKARLFWQGSTHEIKDIACVDCHTMHPQPGNASRALLSKPTEMDTCKTCHKKQVGEQMRFSHHPLREGKMSCSSCHNPHGSPSEKLVKGNSINELCYSCHPKYRGPVIFQHPPVTENCANCHQSHESAYPRLLKRPQARLCRECHVNFHSLTLGANRNATHIAGRLCTDCHVNIHGSNNPDPVFGARRFHR